MSIVRHLRMASKLLKKQRQEIRRFECERKVQFIEAVKKRDALWDRRLEEHRSRERLDALWQEVANETGQSKEECRKLWKSLVDQFRNIYFSVTLKHGEFIEEIQMEKVRWAYFVPLLFLKDVIGKRESTWNCMFQVSEKSDSQAEADEIFSHKDNGIEDEVEYSVEATSPHSGTTIIESSILPHQNDVSMSPQSNLSSVAGSESLYHRRKELNSAHGSAEPKKKKITNEIILADEALLSGILRRERDALAVDNPGRDNSVVFGEYVASLLRRVPESERSNCEFRVIKILNEFIGGKK